MAGGGTVGSIGVVDATLEGDQQLGVVELGPELLELQLVGDQGGVERRILFEVLEEGGVGALTLVLGGVALAEGLRSESLVGGPLVTGAHVQPPLMPSSPGSKDPAPVSIPVARSR